jgi:hypothetical protein
MLTVTAEAVVPKPLPVRVTVVPPAVLPRDGYTEESRGVSALLYVKTASSDALMVRLQPYTDTSPIAIKGSLVTTASPVNPKAAGGTASQSHRLETPPEEQMCTHTAAASASTATVCSHEKLLRITDAAAE